MEPAAYRNSRPRKRMGAGVLFRDEAGRVLVVEPTYKPDWELPGGAVEADESPRTACVREVEEEIGLRIELGRMLCMEWQGAEPDRTESLMFVYDGGVLAPETELWLAPDELASYRFVEPADLHVLMSERVARRTRAAVQAVAQGRLVELEHGLPVRP
ncbi:MAG: putative hydrolase [Frankiales bacterium]|jgi:8-oxo-dGTP diphosphatase|nr:putative hydrolase [Frankiales bacterium]